MKILLTSIGTRGDIEPFVAIGEILTHRGHEVVYSFPEQFEAILDGNVTVYTLSPKIIELIESDEGKIVMGKARLMAKLKAIIHMYKEGRNVNKELMLQQYDIIEREKPDVIIHNAKCNYPVLWGLRYSKKTILVSPVPYFMHCVKDHSHVGFNKNFGAFVNTLTYKIANFGLIKTIYDAQKHLPEVARFSKKAIRKALLTKKLIYAISPQLFHRPAYWSENVQVFGYHERNKEMDWSPEKALIGFLERHSNVLFLTFGSMVNSSPEVVSRMLFQVIDSLGFPVIINTAAGGLQRIDEFERKAHFYFTERIPYDWILKRVYAVVHHGGSGTTHSALKYGCATLIIPHIIDQFSWNDLIEEVGAGPKGISINKLTASRFEGLLVDLLENKGYKGKAEQIASRMREERLEVALYDFIMKP